MHKFQSLTRVLFKNTSGMISDGKTKKAPVYILYAVLAVCFLPTVWLLYSVFDFAIAQLMVIHQEGTILAIGFQLSSFVTFIFSIFLIPGIFYFSKDLENLLAYPLKPQTILASKFSVTLFYEYLFTFFITLPIYVAFVQNMDVSILFYPFAILILLTLPIYPLVLSSIITMLIMRFVPFFKNRDRFNMIAGIASVVLGMGLSFALNSASFNEDPNSLLMMLVDGNNSLIRLFSYLFPGIPFASDALIHGDILKLMIYILINVASLAVFIYLGNKLYFKGAIGMSETSSSRKRFSDADMTKLAHRKNTIYSYMLKELRLIIRTPIYFLNCIGTNFIIPIIFAITFSTSGDLSGIEQLTNIDFSNATPFAVSAGLVLGMLMSNMNLISSTAISREGSNITFMKYVPMSLGNQLRAKVNCGILISTLSVLLMVIVGSIFISFIPITLYLIAFCASLITIVLGNYLGVLIDLIHPKLVWEQEAAAVKQNMSSVIAMFGGMLLSAAIGFLIYFLPFSSLVLSVTITTIALIVACVLFYISFPKIAEALFKKI